MINRKNSVFFIVTCLFFFLHAIGQEQNNFVLNGTTVNPETKFLGISSGFISPDFSNFQVTSGVNNVVDGKFTIEGRVEYPHAFGFMTNTGDMSGMFFLEAKEQSVSFNELNLYTSPVIGHSKTDKEYQTEYLPLVKDLLSEDRNLKNSWNESLSEAEESEIGRGRKRIREEKNIILLQYLKDKPNSYVGMWLFAENFSIYGYNPIHEEMFNAMSDDLKNTYSGKALHQKLEEIRLFSVNGYFPEATLSEINGKETVVKFNELESEFLLIDFWASWCAPCIQQFPDILNLYNETSRDFFDVLAISIDDNKTKKAWKKFLNKKQYPWHQYLDENGLDKKLFITSVPSNFLLDSEGQIVLRNVSVDELKDYLESKKS